MRIIAALMICLTVPGSGRGAESTTLPARDIKVDSEVISMLDFLEVWEMLDDFSIIENDTFFNEMLPDTKVIKDEENKK